MSARKLKPSPGLREQRKRAAEHGLDPRRLRKLRQIARLLGDEAASMERRQRLIWPTCALHPVEVAPEPLPTRPGPMSPTADAFRIECARVGAWLAEHVGDRVLVRALDIVEAMGLPANHRSDTLAGWSLKAAGWRVAVSPCRVPGTPIHWNCWCAPGPGQAKLLGLKPPARYAIWAAQVPLESSISPREAQDASSTATPTRAGSGRNNERPSAAARNSEAPDG